MAKNKKEFRVLSHVERKMRNIEIESIYPKLGDAKVEKHEVGYEVDDNGRIHQVVKTTEIPVKELNKDLKVVDFSINNLSAIGAVDKLKFQQLTGDIDVSLGNVDKLMDSIESQENTNISEGE